MRVERALEKLRGALARRGMMSSSAALGGLLTHHAVTAAPAGMSATVAAMALPGLGSVAALLAFMTWTKLTLLFAATTVLLAVGFSFRREAAPHVLELVFERSSHTAPQLRAATRTFQG